MFMYLVIFACFLLIGIVGIWGGVCLRAHYDEIQSAKVNPAGTLVIIRDDEESYLFLNTTLTPEELAYHKEVVFKVETQNPQIPL